MWNGLSQGREQFHSIPRTSLGSIQWPQLTSSAKGGYYNLKCTQICTLPSLQLLSTHTLTNAPFVKMFVCACWKLPVSWLCLLLRLLSQFAVLGSGASVSMATCWVFWIAGIPSSPHPSLCVAAVCLARFWRALLLDKFSYNSAFELIDNCSYLSLVSHTTNQMPISISYWVSKGVNWCYVSSASAKWR